MKKIWRYNHLRHTTMGNTTTGGKIDIDAKDLEWQWCNLDNYESAGKKLLHKQIKIKYGNTKPCVYIRDILYSRWGISNVILLSIEVVLTLFLPRIIGAPIYHRNVPTDQDILNLQEDVTTNSFNKVIL